MKTHMEKLYCLLKESGYNPSKKALRGISIPMITKDGNNKDIYNNELEYFFVIEKARFLFMLVTDISYLCGQESCLDELADITAKFVFNHNPERLDIDVKPGIFAIRQERTKGIFQTADNSMKVLVDFMGKSKEALQWIVFRTNGFLFNELWPNEDPPELFHLLGLDI
jgi:hypothetical protein